MEKYPLIGKLALTKKILSKEDLDKALSACSEKGQNLEEELIRYLISNKLASSKDIEELSSSVKAQGSDARKNKFGDIASKKGFVSATNLQFILEEQENDIVNSRNPKPLGEMFIEAGMITEKQRDLILDIQKKAAKKITKKAKDKDKAPGSLLMEPVSVSYGLQLQLSDDFLSAFLIKTAEFSSSCTVDDIKDILMEKDIIFGVVTDEMIISFLKSQVFKDKPFRVATGVKPIHGEDAKIAFFFSTEHLKAGGVNTEGQIDFKDRGKIPQVDEGMVLAEKTPMIEAFLGKNIYGESITVESAKDLEMKIGKGAVFSPDGLQVLSLVKGHPKIKKKGEICVLEEYVIDGDVDYETGHIEYDGNINVKGCIKSGFKVKGVNIRAYEVDDGIIDAVGDVKIANGINSGEITVKGTFTAKFVHKSNIHCAGKVLIAKEIIDAVIATRDKCETTGKIISSDITSKLGVIAKDIGTEKGKPSTLRVGIDIFTEKELLENQIKIDDSNKILEGMEQELEEKKNKNNETQQGINKYGQIQDTSQTHQKKILDKMSSLKTNDEEIEYPKAIKEKLEQLARDIEKSEAKLEVYFNSSEELDKDINELKNKIGKQKLQIKNLEFERESLIQWIKENPGKPVVTVNGILMAKTIIHGIHSRAALEEEAKNVKVKEIRDTTPGVGPDAYMMGIKPIN